MVARFLRGRLFLGTSPKRLSEKFFVANLATAAATHSSRQDGRNTIAEELPTQSVLEPLSGEHDGENVGGLATIERRKCSRKRRCAMADRSDATNPTRREPQP